MYDPITLKLSVDPLVLSALKEDVTSEDVTTNAVMPTAQAGRFSMQGRWSYLWTSGIQKSI